MKTETIKIRVSTLEKRVIQNKADKAGTTVSEYLRRTGLETEIRARLTKEEITIYQNLIKLKNALISISNLFKLGDVTGVKEKTIELVGMMKVELKKFQ